MNDITLLMQMIQNGDLGDTSSTSNSYIAYAYHESIFSSIDNRNDFAQGDSAININFGYYEGEGNGVYDIISTKLANKDANELWKSVIAVFPVTGDSTIIENGSRPIVLSHFTYDSENQCLFCDFDFFGKSLYWYKDEGYKFTGTIKGTACISYTVPPKSAPSTLNFNTCTLDASYGVLSYTFTSHHVE